MRRKICTSVLTISCFLFPASRVLAQELHCYAGWTAEYKCLEHCGPCGTDRRNDSRQQEQQQAQQREQQRQIEIARQQEIKRLQEEAERKQKAEDADTAGMEAGRSGNWSEAAGYFINALVFAPDSAEIRQHLERAYRELADMGGANSVVALRQRQQDAMSASRIQAMRQQREDEANAQRLQAMIANFHDQSDASVVDLRGLGDGPLYPVLLRPVAPHSPPAKVLAQYQPKIRTVDEEIEGAQKALRNLIESNSKNQAYREEWVDKSNEATLSAQDLSLSLLIDLLGAHAEHLAETNQQEREVVLQHLLSRAEENGPQNSIHAAYGAVVSRKAELDRLQDEIRLAGKTNDLRMKIRDFDMEKGKKLTIENVWDIITSFKKVEALAGPTKDLLDAAYTIYLQAASCRNMSQARENDEKTLQAAASLQRYIRRLEARKQAEKTQSSRQ